MEDSHRPCFLAESRRESCGDGERKVGREGEREKQETSVSVGLRLQIYFLRGFSSPADPADKLPLSLVPIPSLFVRRASPVAGYLFSCADNARTL